jgi:hypothetical protein
MFFLLALLFCFRKGVDGFLTGAVKGNILLWLRCANTLSVYNGVREFGKVVALTDFARKWPQLLWNFGTIINFISIISVTFCVFYVRISIPSDESSQQETSQMVRIWFAFTTALLWLRFLRFVKSINSTLATFAMAIVQVSFCLHSIFTLHCLILNLTISLNAVITLTSRLQKIFFGEYDLRLMHSKIQNCASD